MNFFKSLVIVAAFSLATISLESKLSLQDCHEIALSNSDKISISDLQVLIEKDRLREVWGLALPQLTAEGQYVAAGEAHKFLKKHKTANGRASLIVPIWNFGAYNMINAQEKVYESSQFGNDRTQQEILFAVSQAYYRVLEAQKIEMVVRESKLLLGEQFRISNDYFSQGLIHKNEVLLVEVQSGQREQDLIQAQNNVALAQARLSRAMGLGLEKPVEIVDVLEEVEWENNLNEVLCFAKEAHPELRSLCAQVEGAYYAYKGEKGNLYPSFYLFSNYSTTNDYNFPYTHGLDAGIGVQMSLYDGGATYAKVNRRQKEWCALLHRYKALEDDIELKIRSAFMNLESAANKVPVALKSIKVAEENLRMTQDQYQEGLVGTFDVLNDEERLAQARSNYYQALYDFHKAQADLIFSSGM